MSDPVTNVEIEDVLSSIRRLVSEETRAPLTRKPVPAQEPRAEGGEIAADEAAEPALDETRAQTEIPSEPFLLQTPAPEPQEAAPASAAAEFVDALVLTPALRVLEDSTPRERRPWDQTEPEALLNEDDLDAPEHADQAAPYEAEQAEAEPVEADQADAPSEETVETEAYEGESVEAEPFETESFETEAAEAEAGEAETDEAEPDATEQVETEAEAELLEDEPQAEPVSEFEPAEEPSPASDLSATGEPESAEQELPTPSEARALFLWTDDIGSDEVSTIAPNQAEAGHDATSDQDTAQMPEPEPARLPEPGSIEAKIAELEALVGHTNDSFEPDTPSFAPSAAANVTSLPWQDSDVQRRPSQAYQGQSEELADGDAPQAAQDPEQATQSAHLDLEALAVQQARAAALNGATAGVQSKAEERFAGEEDLSSWLDEEALRDLVADIVRQELQGALGERITRNVRKLVRREIYRAMASNELG